MEDDNSLPTGQAPPSTAGPSSGLDLPSDPTTYNPDTPWIPVGELQSADELKLSRARAARHRYTLKKKAEKAETEARLEEGRREIEKLQLEQNSLQYYGRALHNLSSYAACMVQALPQAKTSAAEALAAGMHGLESAQEWTRHQYVMIPTAVELMTTSLWTPTEAQMRWALQRTPTSEYENGHEVFFNRIAELLREGQRNPSSQQRVEKRVETLMTLWLRFTMLLLEDNKEAMEQHLCAKQVREFKQREAAKAVSVAPTPAVSVGGGGLGVVGDPVAAIPVNGASIPVSPAAAAVASAFEEDDDDGDEEEDTVLLPDASASRRHIVTIRGAQTTDLGTNFPRLSLQQIEVLGKEWKKFKRSVQGARKDLNRAVGEATAAYIANINFVDGSFAPESSAAMAESYLTTVEAAEAADAFVKRESRAYMELFVNIIQLLSPMQLAHLKTAPNIQPLVPHLPLVCHTLLHQANAMVSSNNTSSGSDGRHPATAAAVVRVPQIQMIQEESS